MPTLLSYRGRGQHGCGDQPNRQNVKSGHALSPLDKEAKTFWLL
jgi:hypothetical protein